jgi:hypothetical protein
MLRMSDADDQMGGSRPQEPAGDDNDEFSEKEDEEADEASRESFPASDPHAKF